MPNILICDDDADIVAALKIYLTQPDYRILTASNGQEALETLEREGRRFRRFTPIPEEQEIPEINEKEIRV